jgi:hypothetical protein
MSFFDGGGLVNVERHLLSGRHHRPLKGRVPGYAEGQRLALAKTMF